MKATKQTLKAALLASTVSFMPLTAIAQDQNQQQDQQDNLPPIEELVVTGQYIPEEKRATSEISNVLDAGDFAATGDSDIAGALQRVTGLSLVNGKFVYVRGLGERYSSALLDGASLPSPEPLRRVVPLDIFPTALLSGALVQKTYSPQYPAEFGGGVIELRTKTLPDETFVEMNVKGTYNGVSTFKKGLSYDGGSTDLLGFDSGLRKLPALIKNNPGLEGLTPDQLEQAGEALPNVWTIDSEPNAPGLDLNVATGTRKDFGEHSLGILFAVNYGSNFANKNGIRRTFVTSQQGLQLSEDVSPESCDAFDLTGCGLRSTEWTINLNGIMSLGFEFNNNHKIKYTTLVLRKTTREATIEQGIFAADPGTIRNHSRIEWIERQVWTNQLSGEHVFEILPGAEPLQLNWHAAYDQADRDAPLRREYQYDFDDFDQVFRLSAKPDGNVTSFGNLHDRTIEAGFDFTQSVSVSSIDIDLKGGFTYFDKDRTSSFRRFVFFFPPGSHQTLRERIPEIVFGPVNIDPLGFVLTERTDASDSFTASLTNYQFYAALDAQLSDKLRLAAGFRYEDSDQTSDTFARSPLSTSVKVTSGGSFIVVPADDPNAQVLQFDRGDPINMLQKGKFLLPAATATYEFHENMQIRLAYSQTLSRPDLRELSFARFLDPDRDRPVQGNPFLRITEIDNYDARVEWYFGPGESATVGVFYKDFQNPIERTFQVLGQSPLRSFANAKSARLIGVEGEVEIALPLDQWLASSSWFADREFYFKANAAYIDSNIKLDSAVANQATNLQRRLQGQSDILANAQIGYDHVEGHERAALLFNFTGNRIADVGFFGAPDFIEDPPILLNFVYARQVELFGSNFEFSLEFDNLLNDDFVLKQGGQVAETYKIGRSFAFGIKAAF